MTAEKTNEETEFESTADEFRALYQETEEQLDAMSELAASMESSAPTSAVVLQQVVGNFGDLFKSHIAMTGAALEAIEDTVGDAIGESDGDSGMDDDDAILFFRTLSSCKLMAEQAQLFSEDEQQRASLAALEALIKESLSRVCDLTGYTEDELLKLSQEAETAPVQPEAEPTPAELAPATEASAPEPSEPTTES